MKYRIEIHSKDEEGCSMIRYSVVKNSIYVFGRKRLNIVLTIQNKLEKIMNKEFSVITMVEQLSGRSTTINYILEEKIAIKPKKW